VGLTVVIIVLFGLVRAYVIITLTQEHQEELLSRTADAAEIVVAEAMRNGDPVTSDVLSGLVVEGERLEYHAAGSPAVIVPEGASEASTDALTADRRTTGGGTLTVSIARDVVKDDILNALAPLVGMALLLLALAGLAGGLLASRLARPFTELAGVAEAFGRGRLDTDVPHYAMPEADAIARALEDSSEKLQELLRRQREVSDYASHDLRTPITALRLTLEDLSLWPSTPPDVAEELARIVGEVDRFSRAVSNLVDTPPEAKPVELVDVAHLVRQAVGQRHGPRSGVVRVEAGEPVLARLQTERARRAVELLVEHATSRSAGGTVARVRDGNGYVTVELEGASGLATDSSTEGVVWDQVAGLAGQLGGRVECTRAEPLETWSLTLPKGHALDHS
jgi:signal transduction histidine kinase